DGCVIKKIWVFKVIDGVPDKITVIKADGNYPANATGIDISIIRSGRRNQQLLSLAQSSLLKNPISPSPLAFDSLLYAASNEFSEQWGIFCDYDIECKDTSNFCTTLCTLVSNDGAAVGCGVKPDDIVNPYLLGIRGNWRLNKNYTYYVNRLPSIAVSTNTREDGTFTSFIPFWEYHIASKTWVPVYNPLHPQHNPSSLYDNWMLNSEITVYSPHGRILENMDLLNRYTALIDGYDKVLHNLPVAIANNARYRQIAYDGFEDFDYRDDAVTCALLGHWNFKKNLPASFIDNTQWHTGKHSLKLTPGSYHSVSREIIDCSKAESRPGPPYYVQPCDCIDYFAPDTGFYVINLWVKENPSSPATHYEDAKIRVYTRDALDATIKTYEFKATGPVIESWQQIEDTFYVSPATKCVVVKLMNEGFTDANYDDIRIHPFKASMLSFVYDPLTLRMMAELDEYNFATIYEYDNDGNLVRVKEETEKGIITKRETRTSIVKN
ncbi:MAG: hypothetical protein IIA45_09750, partial [Bacteroidetes bacterium]|nr:hypothetical protein [Bacteroidota bacterium]